LKNIPSAAILCTAEEILESPAISVSAVSAETLAWERAEQLRNKESENTSCTKPPDGNLVKPLSVRFLQQHLNKKRNSSHDTDERFDNKKDLFLKVFSYIFIKTMRVKPFSEP
jgi:hypothetical protein